MRTAGLIWILVLLISGCALADEAAPPIPEPEKITVITSVKPKELREYKVVVDIKGQVPKPETFEPVNVEMAYTLNVAHRYAVRDTDGLLPLEVSLVNGKLTTGGQTMEVGGSEFPRLTYLMDRDWHVSQFFGITNTQYEKSKPGLNWVNMIFLFYLYGGDTPHALAEKWTAAVKLPVYQETYDFVNIIKSVEKTGGVETAAVQQEIAWTPRKEADMPAAAAKATVLSNFALADGKLIKSHADCVVIFGENSQQERKPITANIKIDISGS